MYDLVTYPETKVNNSFLQLSVTIKQYTILSKSQNDNAQFQVCCELTFAFIRRCTILLVTAKPTKQMQLFLNDDMAAEEIKSCSDLLKQYIASSSFL